MLASGHGSSSSSFLCDLETAVHIVTTISSLGPVCNRPLT